MCAAIFLGMHAYVPWINLDHQQSLQAKGLNCCQVESALLQTDLHENTCNYSLSA